MTADVSRPAPGYNPSAQWLPLHLVTNTDPEEVEEIDGGHRAEQLMVVDRAAPWREQLPAGLISYNSDGVKYRGNAMSTGQHVNGNPYVLGGAIDGGLGPWRHERLPGD